MESKSRLSGPERREVVLSLLRLEEPARVLARRYGVSENTLYRWCDEFMTAGEAALANGNGKADPRDRQISELKKQLGQPHWALIPRQGGDPITPHDVYVEGRATAIPKWQGWAKAAKAKLDELMTEEVA